MTGQFASLDEDLTGRENLVLLARLWGFRGRAGRRPGGRAARRLRPRRGRAAAGQGLLGRHAAPARHRRLAGRDAGRAVPRRADHRPRPRRAQGGLGHDPAARRSGVTDPADHAVPRGGRPARRAASRSSTTAGRSPKGTSRELKAATGSGFLHVALADPARLDAAAAVLEAPARRQRCSASAEGARAVRHGRQRRGRRPPRSPRSRRRGSSCPSSRWASRASTRCSSR